MEDEHRSLPKWSLTAGLHLCGVDLARQKWETAQDSSPCVIASVEVEHADAHAEVVGVVGDGVQAHLSWLQVMEMKGLGSPC